MKKKNYILGIFTLTVCLFSAFSCFANAAEGTIFPNDFRMLNGTHIGGVLSDVYTKNEGDTMDFQQASYTLTIRFYWPIQVRCRSLYFKFDDTVSGGWLTVHIIYKEWWVPRQTKSYVNEGDHSFSLWSAWRVRYVEIVLYNIFIWDQKVFIDYLALRTL